MNVKYISSAELRRRLENGIDIPEWFSYPEVVSELRWAYPPRSKQGFTIFITGLSGAGKSTLAKVLMVKFMEMRDRPVTLLDGDIVRRNLSSELTFSKEHRNLNITRIGFIASEITKNGGIAICAPIAPYEESRCHNRQLISRYGGYIEVYLSTPLEVCEQRDRKGLYAKGREGKIKVLTHRRRVIFQVIAITMALTLCSSKVWCKIWNYAQITDNNTSENGLRIEQGRVVWKGIGENGKRAIFYMNLKDGIQREIFKCVFSGYPVYTFLGYLH